MVEVFKTNIACTKTADRLRDGLQSLLPAAEISFDLEDCDNILRVKGDDTFSEKVRLYITGRGFMCEVLD